ncbi:DYHA protein, partial [Polyodon spathula]|nr:DYHA protein [Polyodon spathula]
RSIPVSVATVKEEFQGYIETALDEMSEQDGWLILENLHLASADFISSLYEKMIRGRKMQNNKRQFRVWLTSELGAPFPQQFISELHKVSTVWHNSSGEIAVGKFAVPIPPDTVDPAEFSFWLCDRLPECSNCTGLALHNSTEKTCHQSSVSVCNNVCLLVGSVELLRCLSEVYEALQCGLPPADQEESATPTGLSAARLAAGLISEQLPSEVRSGGCFCSTTSILNKASIKVPGTTKEEDTEEFEAVRHALLQECSWLDRSLSHIRQQVSGLEKSLLTDTLALPDHLAEVAESLKKDEVPGSWLRPYCQPGTHTLSTWIQDLKKRHSQVKRWVKEGMVHHVEETAGNRIQSVWLGGLVNPGGLIVALQQAYAAANGCLLDKVKHSFYNVVDLVY